MPIKEQKYIQPAVSIPERTETHKYFEPDEQELAFFKELYKQYTGYELHGNLLSIAITPEDYHDRMVFIICRKLKVD